MNNTPDNATPGAGQSASSQSAVVKSNLPSHGYYIFLITLLVAMSAFGSFVNDMYIPALPEMTGAFHCNVSTVQLGLTFGMIGLGLGQIILGPVSDKYGRKPMVLISLLVFIAGAVASIFSPTIWFFLGCRFVQGLGASAGYFLARTIPADIYAGRQLAKVLALVGAINGFAPASAPVIGGLVATASGWRGIFWVLAALALVIIIMAFFFKESLAPEKRAKGPLLDTFKEYKTLVRNRKFMTHVMLKGCGLGLLFAYVSSSPFIMQTHYGFSELKFGLFMGVNSVFTALGSLVALKFKILKNAAWVAGWILLLATVVEASALFFIEDFWAYEMALLPMIFSLGMIFTVGNTLAMNEGRDDAGAASAILGVVGYIFGATVAPLVGLGNILHSTAIVFLVLALLVLVCSYGTRILPRDLDK